MKHYVITIKDIPQSVEYANRCIKSASNFDMKVEQFDAVTPRNNDVHKMLKDEGISRLGFEEKYSRLDNCIAAFLSHYSLWKRCIELGHNITIFEHDAIIVDKIPDFINFKGCVNLGKPSYGKFQTPKKLGVNPLTSKQYFGGAHAYRITPSAAKHLVAKAKTNAAPTDVYLHNQNFSWLEEYYPWPVEVKDTFTTIQREAGCLAKHNYGDTYEII